MPNILQELVQELFARLQTTELDADVLMLAERAVELVDPRLKSFGNYPKAFLPSITQAQHYASELAAMLPECISLTRDRYGQSPFLHALFTDADDIESAMRESLALKEYLAEGEEVYALMGMRRQTKQVFGSSVTEGGLLRSDVAQTMVYFHSHTITLPAASMEGLRKQLEAHFFDSLVMTLAEHIAAGVARRRELETERNVLSARMRSKSGNIAETETRLQEVGCKLRDVASQYSLENYPKLFSEFMAEPSQHLRLQRVEMPIDMRGVMRQSNERLAGNFTFYDLVGRDRRIYTLCPVRLRVDDLLRAQRHVSERDRWLLI